MWVVTVHARRGVVLRDSASDFNGEPLRDEVGTVDIAQQPFHAVHAARLMRALASNLARCPVSSTRSAAMLAASAATVNPRHRRSPASHRSSRAARSKSSGGIGPHSPRRCAAACSASGRRISRAESKLIPCAETRLGVTSAECPASAGPLRVSATVVSLFCEPSLDVVAPIADVSPDPVANRPGAAMPPLINRCERQIQVLGELLG